MHFFKLLQYGLCVVLLNGCVQNSSVSGTTPSKNPQMIAGAAAGAIGLSAIEGVMNQSGGATAGLFSGAILGAAAASYFDSDGLVSALNKKGITVLAQGDSFEVNIPVDYLFQGDDTEINYTAYPMLDNVVKLIKTFGDSPLIITGHSDDVGNVFTKVARSSQQAQSVSTYLWAHGIPIERIRFAGVADTEPVAAFQSASGAAYNRRIAIRLWRHDYKNTPSPLQLYMPHRQDQRNCWKSDNPNACETIKLTQTP